MAGDDKVLSQAEIDALTAHIPSKPRKASTETTSSEMKSAPKREPVLPKPEVASKPVQSNVAVASKREPDLPKLEVISKPAQLNVAVASKSVPDLPKPEVASKPVQSNVAVASKREPDLPKPEIISKPAQSNVQGASHPSTDSREIEALKKTVDDLKKQIQKNQNELDQISQLLNNKQGWNPRDGFQCSNCKSTKLVAIHVKCTSCGETHWIGWWPRHV